VVVGRSDVDRPLRDRDRVGEIPGEPGVAGRQQADRPRQLAGLVFVGDERRSGAIRLEGPLRGAEERIDSVDLAGLHQHTSEGRGEHRPALKIAGGSASSHRRIVISARSIADIRQPFSMSSAARA
jgi:hypothetical protein